ncbi:hypothetical protein GCM10010365_69130 [Streptomyces poonensis]|uniref:Uncharacterized protein n=1 Tax=Streptomyces poonensis TaxID=68255 RepID=A0A918Q9P2_9ACTN|nr:hypothetical protein GCM10010365_69130 [Streptomyces poonensis]
MRLTLAARGEGDQGRVPLGDPVHRERPLKDPPGLLSLRARSTLLGRWPWAMGHVNSLTARGAPSYRS